MESLLLGDPQAQEFYQEFVALDVHAAWLASNCRKNR